MAPRTRRTITIIVIDASVAAHARRAAMGFGTDESGGSRRSIGARQAHTEIDEAYVMLHVEPAFKGFAQQEITDTSKSREVIVGLSADSREQVDDLVAKVVAGGGQALGEPVDDGFMYMQAFRDLDGHQWSFIYMDLAAIPEQ